MRARMCVSVCACAFSPQCMQVCACKARAHIIITPHLASIQSTCQGSLIDDAATGHVDDTCALLDFGKHLVVEQVLGGGQQGHVEGEEVTLLRVKSQEWRGAR